MMPRSCVEGPSRSQSQDKQLQSQEMSPLHLSSPPPQPAEWVSSSQEPESQNNARYQTNHDFVYGHEQQVHWQIQQQVELQQLQQLQQQQLTQRHQQQQQHQQQQPRSSPIAIVRNPTDSPVFPSQASHDDDDSDDGIIDVERDARDLKEKYGDKIMAVSFKGETSISDKLLMAPYLGSMGISEDFLSHRMPPITLSSEFQEASSEEIRGYGSLRDSHQRGRFLDGPASYRDPRSGRILRLDHRLRFHGTSPASLSIGERMQQSRKLKEINKKKQGMNGNTSNGSDEKTSSLSAMMDQVSQEHSNKDNGTNAHDAELNNMADMPNDCYSDMMSTSFTVFEVMAGLRMGASEEPPATTSSVGFHHSHSAQAIYPTFDQSGAHNFQALARSMSDPTPHIAKARNTSDTSLKPQSASTSTTSWKPFTLDAQPGCLNANGITPLSSDPHNLGTPPTTMGSLYDMSSSGHNPDTDGAFDMDME